MEKHNHLAPLEDIFHSKQSPYEPHALCTYRYVIKTQKPVRTAPSELTFGNTDEVDS